MGDFNMNLMNWQPHNVTGELLDMMYSYTCFPLITRPTRITSHSATLFDLLITYFKILSKIFRSVDYYLPIFLIIYQELNTYLIFVIHYEHSKNNEESKPFVFFRYKNTENVSKIRDSLRNIDGQNIYNENDANIAYNSFLN